MMHTIEQYPKNKDLDPRLLSDQMKSIRVKQKRYTYGKTFKCKCCGKTLKIKEFYVKEKHTGRRSKKCRDCIMKQSGVVELGEYRFAKDIFKKQFRRCGVCKNIKPLTEYSRNKARYGGYSSECKKCNRSKCSRYYYKKVYQFKNARDPELLKMFSTSAITNGIKTGKETTITKLSKHVNPCIIERLNNDV